MVPKAGKYFRRPICTERGVTQGDPVSPTIFNIVVDAVVSEVLLEVCGPQESQHIYMEVHGNPKGVCAWA